MRSRKSFQVRLNIIYLKDPTNTTNCLRGNYKITLNHNALQLSLIHKRINDFIDEQDNITGPLRI
jgi:hypothetical protein